MNIYQEHGYESRQDYFEWLADAYEQPISNVIALAMMLGKAEDFDGLVSALEDEDVRGSHKLDNFILTHIPVHPESLARWCGGNAHGHLHSNKVKMLRYSSWTGDYVEVDDPRYLCVSVENTNYTPISLEVVKQSMEGRN